MCPQKVVTSAPKSIDVRSDPPSTWIDIDRADSVENRGQSADVDFSEVVNDVKIKSGNRDPLKNRCYTSDDDKFHVTIDQCSE